MRTLVIGLGRINVKNKDGGAIRLYHVLKYLLGKGISIDVLIPKRDLQNFRDYGVKANFHLLSDPSWMGDNIALLYTWRIIQGIIFILGHKENVDIVYSASDFWHDFLPAIAYKLKYPTAKLVTCLFLMAPPPWKRYEDMYSDRISFPHPWLLLFYLTQRITIWLGKYFCDAFLVLNEIDKTKLVSYSVVVEKIHVVSMGVDIPKIMPEKVVKKYDGVYLGRLHPQKGLFDLLDVWQKVVQEKPNALLVIVGGGSTSDIKKLLAAIKVCNLTKNIKYLGYLDGNDKNKILYESKVMLVPSHYESWGQVIAEGMAAGLPVIAYNLPTLSKIFENNITLIRLYRVNEFSKAALRLISDSGKYLEKLVKDPVFIHQYSWNNVAHRDYRIIRSLTHLY